MNVCQSTPQIMVFHIQNNKNKNQRFFNVMVKVLMLLIWKLIILEWVSKCEESHPRVLG